MPLHRAPGVGFEAPFEMLAGCHERVERMLRLLERLREHLPGHGPDAQAQAAARDVMRYFDQAAPQHHEDEERHVLPALRAAGRAELAERIHADHLRMAGAWARLRRVLEPMAQGQQLPEGGRDAGLDGAGDLAGFIALYRTHVQLEDALAFPLAAACLVGAARDAMGHEMAARRGLR